MPLLVCICRVDLMLSFQYFVNPSPVGAHETSYAAELRIIYDYDTCIYMKYIYFFYLQSEDGRERPYPNPSATSTPGIDTNLFYNT